MCLCKLKCLNFVYIMMKPVLLEFSGEHNSCKVQLPLIHFKDENGIYFYYLPHLDLTGYGKTIDEAYQSLIIVFEEFIEYTSENDTIDRILKDLGWKLDDKMIQPSLAKSLVNFDYLEELFNTYPLNTTFQEVNLPY